MRPKPQAQEADRRRRERQIARGAALRGEWPVVVNETSAGRTISVEPVEILGWALSPGIEGPTIVGTRIEPAVAECLMYRDVDDGAMDLGTVVLVVRNLIDPIPAGALMLVGRRNGRLEVLGWKCTS